MSTAAEMVAEAKRRVENLTVDEAARELEEGERCSWTSVNPGNVYRAVTFLVR